MPDAARTPLPHDIPGRPSISSGPLRDWLAAMRATATETKSAEPDGASAASPSAIEAKATGWAPRLVVPAVPEAGAQASRDPAVQPDAQDDEVAEIVAENMMLKAKLRLEADRRDDLQLLLAQEIRELRAHVASEVAKLEDLRAERDLWKARCEALMQPLFHGGTR